jgi:hypothetical protein
VNVDLGRPTPAALGSPFLARVGGLYLEPVDSAAIDALAGNPNLTRFRHLHIGTGRDSRGLPQTHVNRGTMERLFANPTLGGLRQFTLNGPPHGEAVARGLATGRFSSLQELDLVESRLTADGLKLIVNSPSAPRSAASTWGQPVR